MSFQVAPLTLPSNMVPKDQRRLMCWTIVLSENDHILSLTLLLINILYIIYVLDSFAWISLINVCMYNGSLPVGLGLISQVLLKTNLHYLKVRTKVTLDQ